MSLPRRFDASPPPFPQRLPQLPHSTTPRNPLSSNGGSVRGFADEQDTISRTDDDALAARASAVKCGYWQDEFLKCFVKAVDRKPPIINRGTHIRTLAIDRIVRAFLDAPVSEKCGAGIAGGAGDGVGGVGDSGKVRKQIVSLGAGSDTRYFRLARPHMLAGEEIPFRYHEVDFQHVTQRKALTLTTKRALKDVFHYNRKADEVKVDARRGSIVSDTYCLHPLDLRDVSALSSLPLLDPNIDTLVISEVCLIYLPPDAAKACVSWAQSFFQAARAVCIYEPIGGHDAFGKMMVRNLAQRGLELKTLATHPDIPSQKQRLRDAGFDEACAVTTRAVHDSWIDADERDRMASLEMLDEVEEWYMLAEHYCVSVGWSGESLDGFGELFSGS